MHWCKEMLPWKTLLLKMRAIQEGYSVYPRERLGIGSIKAPATYDTPLFRSNTRALKVFYFCSLNGALETRDVESCSYSAEFDKWNLFCDTGGYTMLSFAFDRYKYDWVLGTKKLMIEKPIKNFLFYNKSDDSYSGGEDWEFDYKLGKWVWK